MAPITIIPKACSCCKGERSSRDKSSNLPLPNILYEGSKGSEGKVLRIDEPSAQGFLSLTALRAEGCGLPCRAMLIKSALRDLLFCIIGLDWHYVDQSPPVAFPLWWLRHHLSPASGGTTTRAKLRVTYEKIASRSFVLPPLAGEVPRSGQGGMPFPRPQGGCMVLYKLAPTIIHRRPTTTLAPKGETTHYDLCVALLLQIMFAVHARGASNLSPLRTFGPAGRQPSSPTGACTTHYLTLSFPFLFPFSFSDSLDSRDLSRK